MPRRTLLSSEQRARLFSIPIDGAEITRYFVLSPEDLTLTRFAGSMPPTLTDPRGLGNSSGLDHPPALGHGRPPLLKGHPHGDP